MKLSKTLRNRSFDAADWVFLINLAAAIALLIPGLIMAAFTNDRLAQGEQALSILGGAIRLGMSGSVGFMLVIILFSVVFPTAKLLTMLFLWMFRFDSNIEERSMHWLELLGKWSMLDVFVVATTIGATHLQMLNRTSTEAGIYVFGLAILLSMLASLTLRHKLRTSLRLNMPVLASSERWLGIAIGLTSLVLFFLGVSLPLFSIEKWVFWNREYSLLTALPKMLAEGEYLLPLVMVVFVILLPMARFLTLTATRLIDRPSQSLVQTAFGFEKWTMWEVYAFALIIVAVKLGDFAALEFRTGFWLIMGMVPLSLLDGWLFRRRLELVREDD